MLLAGCGAPGMTVALDGPPPGLIAASRCVGPAVAGTTPLPADVPVLQAAPYGPAAVVAPQGRVLPERLEARSAVTARVLYDYTAGQRNGAQVKWADLVFELPQT